ncbi:MAG: response regulator [Chloroflexi bacterium]|nr:response regulator [Chloroflexota bacterium]
MGTRILVVDDEEDTLSLLRTILQISGFEPITTLNSIEAIGLAEVQAPEAILLDIMMPRLDGFTLCKMMRQHKYTQGLPIIFVTAYESLDLEERRVDAGADMVIRKPIDIDVLVQAIAKTLAQKAAAQPKVVTAEPADLAAPASPEQSVSVVSALPEQPASVVSVSPEQPAQEIPASPVAEQPKPDVAASPVAVTQEVAVSVPVSQTQEHQPVEQDVKAAGDVK